MMIFFYNWKDLLSYCFMLNQHQFYQNNGFFLSNIHFFNHYISATNLTSEKFEDSMSTLWIENKDPNMDSHQKCREMILVKMRESGFRFTLYI